MWHAGDEDNPDDVTSGLPIENDDEFPEELEEDDEDLPEDETDLNSDPDVL